MPRARKTRSGDPAQNIQSVPGQRYGEGVAQQALQRNLPAPERTDQEPRPIETSRVTDVNRPNPPREINATRVTDVNRPRSTREIDASRGTDPYGFPPARQVDLSQFIRQLPKNMLSEPAVPGRPLTSGLPVGPGPGPSGIGPSQVMSKYRRVLLQLAASSDNPMIRRLLERN